MIRYYTRPYLEKLCQPVAIKLANIGVSPNMLTGMGLLSACISAYCFSIGFNILGSILLIVLGLCDVFDGMVARCANKVTKLGAFLDSCIDRYTEALILFGLFIFYLKFHHTYSILIFIILIGAVITSYIKARAESSPVEVECKTGIVERPERIFIIFCATLFNEYMLYFLIVLAILTHITAIQRIIIVWYALKKL